VVKKKKNGKLNVNSSDGTSVQKTLTSKNSKKSKKGNTKIISSENNNQKRRKHHNVSGVNLDEEVADKNID